MYQRFHNPPSNGTNTTTTTTTTSSSSLFSYRLPISTREGLYAGELSFSIHWTKVEPKLRQPFKFLASIAGAGTALTSPISHQIETLVDGLLYLFSSMRSRREVVSGKGVLVGALMIVLGTVGAVIPMIIPAIIFFPVTIIFLLVSSGGGSVFGYSKYGGSSGDCKQAQRVR